MRWRGLWIMRNELPKISFLLSGNDIELYLSRPDYDAKISFDFVCPECSEIISRSKKYISTNGHSFCTKCSFHLSRLIDITGNKYSKLTVIEFSHTDKGTSFWHVVCDCGRQKIVEKGCLVRGGVKSCGCLVKNNGCKLMGENHPNWNPLLTNEERRMKRDTMEYGLWRKSVYSRDEYTCVKCRSDNARINAHHIYNWATYQGTRYFVENGITLCEKCHKKLHKKYGKVTTASDLVNFLGFEPESVRDLNFILDYKYTKIERIF